MNESEVRVAAIFKDATPQIDTCWHEPIRDALVAAFRPLPGQVDQCHVRPHGMTAGWPGWAIRTSMPAASAVGLVQDVLSELLGGVEGAYLCIEVLAVEREAEHVELNTGPLDRLARALRRADR